MSITNIYINIEFVNISEADHRRYCDLDWFSDPAVPSGSIPSRDTLLTYEVHCANCACFLGESTKEDHPRQFCCPECSLEWANTCPDDHSDPHCQACGKPLSNAEIYSDNGYLCFECQEAPPF